MLSLVGGEAFGCHMEGEVLRSFDGRALSTIINAGFLVHSSEYKNPTLNF